MMIERLAIVRGTPQNPTFDIGQMESLIVNFALRPSDVFICSYMRSGTSWVQQIVHLLRHGGNQADKSYRETCPWLEAVCSKALGPSEAPGHTLASINATPTSVRRFFKTHATLRDLPGSKNGTDLAGKVIYVARNPKDVAVSQYHHLRDKPAYRLRISFSEFLECFRVGAVPNGLWFQHVLEWWRESQRNPAHVLFIKYEDMLSDTAASVKAIASFLDIGADEQTVLNVVDGSGLDAMKSNPLTYVGFNHFRKGACGGWREYFTARQSEEFDALYNEKMAESGLTFDFGGPVSR